MPDLGALFGFHVHPLEIVLRGSAVYWFLFLLFRFVLRRDAGALGIADILLLVLIADASQNAMAGGYDTIAEGVLLEPDGQISVIRQPSDEPASVQRPGNTVVGR